MKAHPSVIQTKSEPKVLTSQAILELPAPVQDYLTYTGAIDKPIPKKVRLWQEGEFNLSGSKWIPLTAEQDFILEPCEFIWKAKARFMHVVDQFKDNKGRLTVRLFNRFKVDEAEGPEIDQGEAQRFLAECIWFPWAFTSERICWEIFGKDRVRAHFEYGHFYTYADFHFNGEGAIIKITAKRFAKQKDKMALARWEIHDLEYAAFHGLCIPCKAKVGWWSDGILRDYYRFEVTKIDFLL